MTDKQIIIDGINVSELTGEQLVCMNRYEVARLFAKLVDALSETEDDYNNVQEDRVRMWTDNTGLTEKLKRKEQEYKELKKELQAQRAFTAHEQKLIYCIAYDETCKTGNDCKQEKCIFKDNIKLKQALAEIKEIAETAAKCLYATESDDYTDGYRWLGSIILQKIRKCEVENEGFCQENKADKGDIGMSKYENDPQYEHKFFVVKCSIIQQELDFLRGQESVAYHNVLCFLKNVANRAKDKEYLVINQDEPYADKVWELIKQGEKKSNK